MITRVRVDQAKDAIEEGDLEIRVNGFVDHSIIQIRSDRIRGTLILSPDCGIDELHELAEMIYDSLENSSMEGGFMVDENEKGC